MLQHGAARVDADLSDGLVDIFIRGGIKLWLVLRKFDDNGVWVGDASKSLVKKLARNACGMNPWPKRLDEGFKFGACMGRPRHCCTQ